MYRCPRALGLISELELHKPLRDSFQKNQAHALQEKECEADGKE